MNLIKEIRTSELLVQIYSLNPNLAIGDDYNTLFENKNDEEIKEIVFNQIGAEQVSISNIVRDMGTENLRTYATA